MRYKKILFMVLMSVILVGGAEERPSFADSLWSNNGGKSLFSDRKASGIGDIVMVRVSEEIDDSDEGQTSSSKTTNENVNSGFGLLKFISALGFGSASAMDSDTTIERTKELDMIVSCIVTDVTPNGNMVIQGDRHLLSGAEKMKVSFTGVVRPQDVLHNNTVDSNRVANAEIVVNGKGVISRTQRPGIINQILQAIF
jgi:flagellar L-ring protein precursor FlgH